MRIANFLLRNAYLSSLWFAGALVAATLSSLYLSGSYGSIGLTLTSSLIAVSTFAVLGGMAASAAGWIAYRRAVDLVQRATSAQTKSPGAAFAEIG